MNFEKLTDLEIETLETFFNVEPGAELAVSDLGESEDPSDSITVSYLAEATALRVYLERPSGDNYYTLITTQSRRDAKDLAIRIHGLLEAVS